MIDGMMRSAGVALVLLALGASEAAAQRPVRLGVIGGANLSGAWGDDAEGTGTRTGFDVGGLVQLPMGDMITIQPEVHYTQKGYEVETAGFESEVSLNYIQVPILFRAGVPLAEGFDVDFQVGPSFGFLVSCEASAGSVSADCDESVKSFDYGIIAGGSFSWAAGPGDLLFDIRYDLGLTAIGDQENAADVKNTNFQFLVGYAFPM